MPKAPRSIPKHKRHKKWLARAKGFRGRRKNVFKIAKEAVLKAGQHAYTHRRDKKGDFRRQWQATINAGVRRHGVSYSKFINLLKTKKIELNRKVLAEIAENNSELFGKIVEQVKK